MAFTHTASMGKLVSGVRIDGHRAKTELEPRKVDGRGSIARQKLISTEPVSEGVSRRNRARCVSVVENQ